MGDTLKLETPEPLVTRLARLEEDLSEAEDRLDAHDAAVAHTTCAAVRMGEDLSDLEDAVERIDDRVDLLAGEHLSEQRNALLLGMVLGFIYAVLGVAVAKLLEVLP